MTDRDFNTLLETAEQGLDLKPCRIYGSPKPTCLQRNDDYLCGPCRAEAADEALADLRTRIEKVEALVPDWRERRAEEVRHWETDREPGALPSARTFEVCANALTQALQREEE